MESEPTRSAPEEWLQHAAWLNKLARSLVSDPNVADDLVQDTWVASLRHAPHADRPLRPWLARVLTNFARQKQRSESSRARRELQSEDKDPWPSASDLVSRLEGQRLLVEALLRIDEPFRETIVLRYFEDKSAADIARTKGIPQPTVRWRLMRGLELLRAELDRKTSGDRSAWMLALVPLVRPSFPASTLTASGSSAASAASIAGGVLMKDGVKAAFLLAAVAALSIGLWTIGRSRKATDTSSVGSPFEVSNASVPESDQHQAAEVPSGSNERTQLDAAADPVSSLLAKSMQGRVLDSDRTPIENVSIRATNWPSTPMTTSSADGRWQLAVPIPATSSNASEREWIELELRHPTHATGSLGIHLERSPMTFLGEQLMTQAAGVHGRVIDRDHRPVAGAVVYVRHSSEAYSGTLEPDLRRSAGSGILPSTRFGMRSWFLLSAKDGTFALDSLPEGSASVSVMTPWAGYWNETVTLLPNINVTCPDIVLAVATPERAIRGRVLAPDGTAVQNALVADERFDEGSGAHGAHTNADGDFYLSVGDVAETELRISDTRKRWRDVRFARIAAGTSGLELRFAEARPLSLRVRDSKGTPIESFSASVMDTYGAIGGAIDLLPQGVHANGDGRLRMPLEAFRLRVYARGYESFQTPDFDPADVPATIECTLKDGIAVRGRVLADGRPIERATVEALPLLAGKQSVVVADIGARPRPMRSRVKSATSTEQTTTDAQGAFALSLWGDHRPRLLRVKAPGRAPALLWSVNASGRELEIELGAGGSIEGRVEATEREDLSGVIIGATCGDGAIETSRTDSAGQYRFEHCTPGRWQMRILTRERTPYEERTAGNDLPPGEDVGDLPYDCEVVEGQTSRFDFPASALVQPHLRGIVTVNGQPVEVAIYATSLEPHEPRARYQATTRSDGSFELLLPQTGRFELEVIGRLTDLSLWHAFDALDVASAEARWSREIATGQLQGLVSKDALRQGAPFYCVTRAPGELLIVSGLEVDSDGRVARATPVVAGATKIVRGSYLRTLAEAQHLPSLRDVVIRAGEVLDLDQR